MNMMFINVAHATNLAGTDIACGGGTTTLTNLINFFTCTIIQAVVPMFFALAIAGFVYGVTKYFLNPDNEEKRKSGKSFMLWGIVTLFVIVSIWGLVGILSNTFLKDSPGVIPSLKIK